MRDECAWLIEYGGLCLGVCEGKLRWVTFTDELALRFSRQVDAGAFISVCRREWRDERVVKALQGVSVAEHMWCAPAKTA